jgi:predicted glycoside hydrolase/deacetylase ChbG (UPF0249 family)
MTIQLMITCDDAALSHGIDQSTANLYQQGMVSAASLMTNFPQVWDAFAYYADYPELELGVHLNLSDGKPLTNVAHYSELVRGSGKFHNRFVLFAYSVFPSDKLLAIMREEMIAQIEVFMEADLKPAHLTTHCHFHVFPSIRALVYELAEIYDVKWVRNSNFRVSVVPFNPMLTLANSNGVDRGHDFFVPDYLVSLQHWLDHPPSQLLSDILKLEGTVELILHPSIEHDDDYPSDVRYLPDERHKETIYLEQFFEILQPYIGGEVQIVNGKSIGIR